VAPVVRRRRAARAPRRRRGGLLPLRSGGGAAALSRQVRLTRAGHFDGERADDELSGAEVNQPVAGGWPVVEVDTGAPVDVAAVAARVRAAGAG
jgi:hypothetical protein